MSNGSRVLLVLLLGGGLMLWVGSRFRVLQSPYDFPQAELLAMESFPYDDWEDVLAKNVDEQGRVNMEQLLGDRAALDRFVALIGSIGPLTRPSLFRSTPQQRKYYLSVYNALVLFNAVQTWPLGDVSPKRTRFFYSTRFLIDGRKANLYELEQHLLRVEFPEIFREQGATENQGSDLPQPWNWSLAGLGFSAD